MIGKSVRLERIIDRNSGRTVIIPMDHGVTVGPIKGLTNMRDAVSKVVAGGANAVLMHKGSPRFCHRGSGKDVGLIIHLSAGTTLSPDPNAKELACTVEEALKLRIGTYQSRRGYRQGNAKAARIRRGTVYGMANAVIGDDVHTRAED